MSASPESRALQYFTHWNVKYFLDSMIGLRRSYTPHRFRRRLTISIDEISPTLHVLHLFRMAKAATVVVVSTSASRSRHGSSTKRCLSIFFIAVIVLTSTLPYFVTVPLRFGDSSNLPDFLRPVPQALTTAAEEERHPAYHVVFSTSCTPQQHWESYIFFYHCMRVRQHGSVTRIASGCDEQGNIDLRRFHNAYIAPMAIDPFQSFELHVTPDYSRVRLADGHAYKYMNKPYGLRHWMENSLHLGWSDDNKTVVSSYNATQQKLHDDLIDGIVILMDPDMILLKPIGYDFSDDHEMWVEKPDITKVTHGHPIAQQDGYLDNEWMRLNFTYITGTSAVKPPPTSEGPVHWNTGPPYLATVSDMYKIASRWTELAPRVLDVYPHLFAEMYGFIIATVELKLPFALTRSIVVSTTESSSREGWAFVDALRNHDVCRAPVAATSTSSSSMELPVLPTALHYCKRYLLGKVGHFSAATFVNSVNSYLLI